MSVVLTTNNNIKRKSSEVSQNWQAHTCRKVWGWVAETQKLLLFLFFTDTLPKGQNNQVLLHQPLGKKTNQNPGRHDQYMHHYYYSGLAWSLPGNTTGAQTAACGHPLTSIPNGSLPLWQMLYCFDSLLQLFHVGTFGLGGGRSVLGSSHPDALLVSPLPSLSLMTR